MGSYSDRIHCVPVPDTRNTFDPQMQFRKQDFNVTGPLSFMMAEITWAQIIQFRQKILRIPVLPVESKAICPVMCIHYMLEKIPTEPSDPAFTTREKGENCHSLQTS